MFCVLVFILHKVHRNIGVALHSEKALRCAFCPNCGSRLWHEYEPESEVISIKGGSLDQPLDISKATYMWVTHKLPGIIISDGVISDGVVQFPKD